MWIDKEALTEVDAIIQMMPVEESQKIPEDFKRFLQIKKSVEYIPNISKDIPLYKQELKEDTKTICSLIYRNYLCSQREKERLENKDKEALLELKKDQFETYNFDEMLKRRKMDEMLNHEIIKQGNKNELVQYKKQGKLKILIDKILNYFRKHQI